VIKGGGFSGEKLLNIILKRKKFVFEGKGDESNSDASKEK